MKSELPTLYDLIMVESLVYHKSIVLAAKELDYSCSALSRQLSSLESNLGIKIFDRDTRNLSLTESGMKFYQTARKVLSATEEFVNGSCSHLKSRLERLSIVAMPSVTGTLLPKLLSSFMKKNPEIYLVIHDLHSAELIETIYKCDVDLGITLGTVSLRSKLSFLPLIEDKFKIISSKYDSKMNKSEYSLEELVHLPIIAGAKGTGTREIFDSAFEQADLIFTPQIEVSNASTAATLVEEGFGITILPSLILQELNNENLNSHEFSDFNRTRQIGIATPMDSTLSPIANQFVNHVKKEMKPLIESLEKQL